MSQPHQLQCSIQTLPKRDFCQRQQSPGSDPFPNSTDKEDVRLITKVKGGTVSDRTPFIQGAIVSKISQ